MVDWLGSVVAHFPYWLVIVLLVFVLIIWWVVIPYLEVWALKSSRKPFKGEEKLDDKK